MDTNTPTGPVIVREKRRAEITGIDRTSWFRLVKAGRAPKPVPLGDRARGYVLAELYAFNAQRIAERDARAA